MITVRRSSKTAHRTGLRIRIMSLLAAATMFAATLLCLAATPSVAQPPPDCLLRACISDIAWGAYNDPTVNREAGGNNCNFFSGYWGNSGDDVCGWLNGHYYRSNEWCADFVRYVWYNAGANVTGLDTWAGSFYRANAGNGYYHVKGSGYVPSVGDAVIFDWDGTAPSLGNNGWDIDHVGIVIQYSNGWQNTIDGNTTGSGSRDGVYWKGRDSSRVVGYITPRRA